MYHLTAICELYWNWTNNLEKQWGTSSMLLESVSFHSHLWIQVVVLIWKLPNLSQIIDFSAHETLRFDRWLWKKNGHFMYATFKLCAWFHRHLWIQTGVAVWKCSIQNKIGALLSLATLQFNGWPWKTIGHPFYGTSSLVHHFIAICDFKVELQSRNA